MYSEDGQLWRDIRFKILPECLSDEYGGLGFTGAFVGMFCCDFEKYSKYADFEYFSYLKK